MKSRLKMTMTERNETSVKWFRYILSIVLVFVIAGAVIGCKQNGGNPEEQARAALEQLLSCTLQQAEEFDAAAEITQASMESETDSEPGLTQDDGRLWDYLIERFGGSMTDVCIEELAMNRTFYQSITLARQFDSDIEAGEIELAKCSGEQECYTFSAEIKASAGDSVAAAQGKISMKKDEEDWKAYHITVSFRSID